MNIEIIMQHGWGYDSSIFKSWVKGLEELPWPQNFSIKTSLLDRGYFGNPISLENLEFKTEENYIRRHSSENLLVVVAHSLGLHLLPAKLIQRADYLISICSFANFHKDAPGGERRSRLLVGRMLSRLNRNPLEVLSAFYKITDPGQRFRFSPSDMNVEQLRNDLLLLDRIDLKSDSTSDTDIEPLLLPTNTQFVVIHGLEDTLVSEQQSLTLARSLNAHILICRAGHDLPITHKNECIELITKIILARNEQRSFCCA